MRHLLSAPLAILVLAAGCDAGTPPQSLASASAARPPAPKTAPSATPKPEGDGFGFFNLVASGEDMTIYPMGDAAIVDTGAFLAVLGEGPLEQDPMLFRSSIEKEPGKTLITVAARLSGFHGLYPDQAWATGEAGTMKLVNDLWTRQDFLRDGEKVLDLAPWEKKRAVAAVRMAQPDIRFTLAGSASGGVVPAPGKPTADQEGCAVRMDPDAPLRLGGLPTGHLFAVGKECKTGKPVVERWAPGKVRGEVDVLEGVSGTPAAVVAASPEEAYAFFTDGATGHVATWNGKAWKGEPAPWGAFKSAWVARDGEAWALGEGGLYEHPKGGAWEQVKVGSAKVTSAWARDSKVVWIVADKKSLVRSGARPTKVVRLARPSDVRGILDRDRRWPASDACKRVWVDLATLGPSDKVPTTFAGLTEAVKGNAELTAKEIQYLVEDVGGTLHAGAKVPSAALAEKLATAFRTKNPTAKPLVFCHEPQLVKGPLKVE